MSDGKISAATRAAGCLQRPAVLGSGDVLRETRMNVRDELVEQEPVIRDLRECDPWVLGVGRPLMGCVGQVPGSGVNVASMYVYQKGTCWFRCRLPFRSRRTCRSRPCPRG